MKIITTALLVMLTASILLLQPCEVSAFSVGDEREIGEQLLSLVRKEFKLLDEPDITQYIDSLGKELLTAAGPQYFDYHFFVISDKEVNAFAAPSGLLFFHSGLIEVMDQEDELASVMAHEVAHVAKRHLAGRIEKAKVMNAGTMAMMLAGMALGKGEVSEAIITGSMAANVSMALKFSREDEEESDRLAYLWMQGAERDPAAMVSMLSKLRRMTQFMRGSMPPYLLTHPESGMRLGYVQDMVMFAEKKSYKKIDNFNFLRIKYRLQSLTKPPESLIPYYMKKAGGEATDEQSAMAHYGLALCYAKSAQFDKAVSSLAKVIDRYPDKSILQADMGRIYSEAGQPERAVFYLQKASDANPGDAYAAYYLAEALQQQGELARASGLYEELLTVLPDYAKLYYQLGKLKADEGSKGVGFYYLGMYYWFEGNLEQAKSFLGQAVENLPTGDNSREKAEVMIARIEKLKKNNKL